ncbi:hypothetical protein ACHAP6_007258 [Verticillium nonalfalfae]
MGFQAVCRALYDYVPQADAELAISEGDLLYILDKSSDDGWWKAKKKANTDDGDEPIDEDWILVGLGDEYGFAPANYLEMQDGATEAAATSISDTNIAQPPAQYLASGGFHMYNINEMVSVMGKRKKMPTVLGINLATGTILIAPERTQDGPTQEWTAEKMVHYSRETKHVFLELVKPSKSVDFHAGAKDTAEEIVSALGELAGAVRAQGLREEIFADAGKAQKKGQVLYDFVAQGDDEVSVSVGDEVIILDDAKSDEWWQVRRLKNGSQGVVPSSYIEATGITSPATRASNSNAGLSTVEQNRLEEIRLTKEAMKAAQHDTQSQVGPEPDAAKVRTWTDRSKSFSVDAQFLGLKDGKINLHKMNGVKIAVPIAKMSLEDLEYVEAVTGISLDEDKPLSSVKRNSKTPDSRGTSGAASTARLGAGASVEQPPQRPEYDWFQFFLSCDVAVGVCERYAQAFAKESMDESILPDVDASVLRNLGLREGDILKVMRHLDTRFGRTGSRGKRNKDGAGFDDDGGEGGLFSGPGGALRNNTRKGRPAPAVQTSDVVDAQAFGARTENKAPESQNVQTRDGNGDQSKGGFDDDAWDVRPGKSAEEPKKVQAEPTKPTPALTGSMQELSLLTAPLEPTKPLSSQTSGSSPATQPPAVSPQPTGATPAFFAPANMQNTQQAQQQAAQRLRPALPQASPTQSSLVPPPPARPLSAPQSAQNSGFAPPALAPQMTGLNYQTRVAPPGQSLDEVTQARLQQQFLQQQQIQQQQQQQQQIQQQQIQQMQQFPMPAYSGQHQLAFPNAGVQPASQFVSAGMTGTIPPQATGPFGGINRQPQFSPMQPQATGYVGPYPQAQPFNPQPTGTINSFLPPALEPQRTGLPPFQPQPAGFTGNGSAAQTQPLQPQQTGPAPPVRFGVTGEAKRLAPQPTGRRANLSQASMLAPASHPPQSRN